MSKIITVCLPVYAMKIAWLAMESLCRQKTDIKWELIVFEDEQYPNGVEFYKKYSERLNKAGCISVRYKYSEKRISLAEKWRLMALMSASNSVGILLQGADNYAEPYRIQNSFHALSCSDWTYCPNALFFHLKRKEMIRYFLPNVGIGGDMGIKRELAIQLPNEIKWSSVDTWIFENLKKIKPTAKIHVDTTNNWKWAINTHGENRISASRGNFFVKIEPPFYETKIKIDTYLPIAVVELLNFYENN